jgi:Rrf2 family protein
MGVLRGVSYIRPKESDIDMLKLSKKADYGLIAVRHLAEQPPAAACSAREIASTYGIPTELLAKILQKLAKNRLLVSQHGTNGGYTLARRPSEITAFEVIRAIEGPLFITSCVTDRRECGQMLRCTVREPLHKVNETLVKALSAVTIASLSGESSGLVQIGSAVR